MNIKKIAFVSVMAALLTGCGASLNGNYQEVDCNGYYKVKTFPVNETYPVKINAVRENRFGDKSYRASTDQKYVKFVGRWQKSENFEYVECK